MLLTQLLCGGQALSIVVLGSNPVSANEVDGVEKRIYEAEHTVATARAIIGSNIQRVVSLQLQVSRVILSIQRIAE